jgi:hypothetical protein
LNFFSVRNHNDESYGKGREVDKGIYEINGFQIRFFTDKEIQDLASAEGFEILWIKEEYEDQLQFILYRAEENEHTLFYFGDVSLSVCWQENMKTASIKNIGKFILFEFGI